MELLASKLRAAHKHPYVITGGGSDPMGALGYVNAAWELARQAEALNLDLSHLVVATGSGGTQAGLVAGLAAAALPVCVLGIGVRAPRERQEAVVFDLASRTAALIGCEGVVRRDQVVANCDYIGEGYGVPSVGTREAIKLLARTEGLLLDPVYSGKAMDGLIDLIGKGFFPKDRDVVFLHTGGSSALFGYPDAFELAGYA
jgi:L-cysteate sulfo-lyase